jgi:tetratricopeptide (TPR) repeat protein
MIDKQQWWYVQHDIPQQAVLWVLIAVCCVWATNVCATTNNTRIEQQMIDVKTRVFSASLTADLSALLSAERDMVALLASSPQQKQSLLFYYIGFVRLSVSNICDEEQKEGHINRAIEALERCVQADKQFADGFALLSAAYGQKAGLGLFAAMKHGMKSISAMDKALELAPDNPRVQMLHGVATYFKPGIVGGNKQKGIEILRKANRLFMLKQSDGAEQTILPTWGFAESFAWLGMVALEAGERETARQYFDRALMIAPQYAWVKTELYPKLSSQQ